MSSANKIKQYKALRQICINQISEMKIFAQKTETDKKCLNQFKMLTCNIDQITLDFKKHHENIISLVVIQDEAFDGEEILRRNFEFDVSYIKAVLISLIEDDNSGSSADQNILRQNNKNKNLKLSRIELPKFSGEDITKFKGFLDLYNSLIHNNEDLADIEKFKYLISHLEGQALAHVEQTPLSEDNYEIAYKSLVDKFYDRKILAFTHLQAIDDAPYITSPKQHTELNNVLTTFNLNISALKNMGFNTDDWDFLLLFLLSKHLDDDLLVKFEVQRQPKTELPTYKDLFQFAYCKSNAQESIDTLNNRSNTRHKMMKNKPKEQNSSGKPKHYSTFFSQENKNKFGNCLLCNYSHQLYACSNFHKKSPQERHAFAKQRNVCLNCLSPHHITRFCKSTSVCKSCGKRHHSLLHLRFEQSNESSDQNNLASQQSQPTTSKDNSILPNSTIAPIQSSASASNISTSLLSTQTNQTNFCGTSSTRKGAILGTAVIDILDGKGFYQKARVLIDCGSEINYISENCVKRLGLRRFNCNLAIDGLCTMQYFASKGAVNCTLKPANKPAPSLELEAVILPKICENKPTFTLTNYKDWTHITDIPLADVNFYKSLPIDILLGCEIYPEILLDGKRMGNLDEPAALNTIFGYIIMGKLPKVSPLISPTSLFTSTCQINDTLKSFWEIEEIPQINQISPDDKRAENNFKTTHSRTPDGRYIVELPFKYAEPSFDYNNTRALAVRRFLSLEKRLKNNPQLRNQYSDIIKEYKENGYLESIDNKKINNVFYIPHHCVSKVDKPNSIRIVFDASAQTNYGSLNDQLLRGPKLQKDIVSILLNFRLHPVVFTSDIKGMFTQILIAEKHRDYQRLVWRFSPQEEIQDFRLARVTFGLTSSPFLANRTLIQLIEDNGSRFPIASQILKNDVFVDDICSGCDSLENALKARNELIELCKTGGFELRKWTSNSSEFLNGMPESQIYSESVTFNNDQNAVLKILGLQWRPFTDEFAYKIDLNYTLDYTCTKRSILSRIARIYDPLGFLCPVTFLAKRFLQQLWCLGLEWDEIPPQSLCKNWKEFIFDLSALCSLRLPRLMVTNNYELCEIHGFSDASEKGYACVTYFRFSHNNKFSTFFITAKSKIASLKTVSVPRLELLGAVLLAKLLTFVINNFKSKIKISQIFAWTDSSIVLTWIKSPPYKFKTFVANRISYIQEKITPDLWHYVSTENNPADFASRGLFSSEIIHNKMWWSGPSWLRLHRREWPRNVLKNIDILDANLEEKCQTFVGSIKENIMDNLIQNYSSLSKLQTVFAYILRIIHNLKSPSNKRFGLTSNLEKHEALMTLVKHIQSLHFSHDISLILKKKLPSKPLRKLNVFLDNQGVLRVGGRLRKSMLSYDAKFPALLPRNSALTDLIIRHFHRIFLHPGTQTLQYLIMQQFWIQSIRRAIKKCTYNCKNCWRLSPKPFQPPMGDLPLERISQIKPFLHVAVDYAGPFTTTLGKTRSAKTFKSYICVFVCFSTKAIHLELASDLTSEAFLACFRRFIARRGRVEKLYSDCGTNFQGAHKQIQILLRQCAESEKIDWHFNPPSAPHFSGLAEAGVKSTKTHLYRIIGEQILTFEEFYTLLCQIESILNSRPLYPLSNDANDLSVLTPAHFLTLQPLSSLPDFDYTDKKLNTLSRWQLLQRFQQDFWRRWHREYLHTLQQRSKWLNPTSESAVIGKLVVIKNEVTPPLKWNMGKIVALHPGADGVVRVATVRTQQGIFKRPLVKLCPLPGQN